MGACYGVLGTCSENLEKMFQAVEIFCFEMLGVWQDLLGVWHRKLGVWHTKLSVWLRCWGNSHLVSPPSKNRTLEVGTQTPCMQVWTSCLIMFEKLLQEKGRGFASCSAHRALLMFACCSVFYWSLFSFSLFLSCLPRNLQACSLDLSTVWTFGTWNVCFV